MCLAAMMRTVIVSTSDRSPPTICSCLTRSVSDLNRGEFLGKSAHDITEPWQSEAKEAIETRQELFTILAVVSRVRIAELLK